MKTRIFTIVTLLSVSLLGWAEYTDYISLTSMETYTQDFNAIGGEDVDPSEQEKTAFVRATTLPNGWKVMYQTTAQTNGTFASATNSTTYIGGQSLASDAKNGLWNFGATGSTDRAVGGITTNKEGGARTINVMARLKNNTGSDINSLALSYDIEKYRKGLLSAGFSVELYTSPDGETWTRVGEGYRKVFKADSETAGALVVPIRTKLVSGAFDVSFAKNSDLYILWSISPAKDDAANNAQAIGIDNVSITPSASATSLVAPVASGELFATYQKFGDRFYKGGSEANLEALSYDWDVNYYIVSCGDSVLLRATTEEPRNLENEWKTQLRIWTGEYKNSNEIQVNAGENKNRYTSECKTINSQAEDVKIHFFVSWEGNCTTQTFDFNRTSINNPIEDNVAPVINPSDVTMTESDGKLVFTFGEVTADDEYFYYVADKDHNLGGISLNNKVYITKPTIEDGTTYKFKCYAVDYNGNKSAYKEFTLEMPFDSEIDLAAGKSCIAGYSNGTDTPKKAVNGNEDHWGTYGISDYSKNWWRVDLGNAYNLSHIDITFATTNTYRIETSMDDANWQTILDNQPATSPVTHTGLTCAARYIRLTAIGHNMIAIRHFKVYATGVAAADATNPTLSASCTAKTVTSATLQIIAADKDDADNDGTITSIKVSDTANGFAEQEVLSSLDGENKITLTGLKDNTTYNFTVTAYDLAGNHTSEVVEVVLPFNTELNLALGRGDYCSADATQGANSANKAVDGNSETFWTSFAEAKPEGEDVYWWQVDLGEAYDIREIKIHFNNIWGTYSIYASSNNLEWFPIVEVAPDPEDNTTIVYSDLTISARYLKVTCGVSQIGIKEFEVYGTAFSVADETTPVVSVTCPEKTINTATLQIDATDKDDAGEDGVISAIHISGDNGFETQENVTLDENNQIMLSGLTYNTTYTFTVTVLDRHRNQTVQNITVQLPLNTNLNLAQGKSAVAGKTQGGDVANNGCDGNEGTQWSSYGTQNQNQEWWYVDLKDKYTIRQIKIKWANDYARHFLIQGVNTLPAEEHIADDSYWTTYLDYTYDSDPGTTKQEHNVVGKMRYLRLKSLENEEYLGIEFYELEVYGSDYAELDEDAPELVSKSCETDTETATATITLTANDAIDGAIKDFYISCANPVMPETKYTTDENNQIAISGLAIDKDYTFDIRFRDLSGNWSSTSVIAHFAMALGTNVAQGKTATAGREEDDHEANLAFDGLENTYWGCYPNTPDVTETWLKVDLDNAFKLDNIAIKWEHYPDNGGIIIEGSLNDESYSEIISYSGARFNSGDRQVLEITGEQANVPYKYIRIKAENQSLYMSMYEFEVYASEEIALLSFGDASTTNTDLIAAHHDEYSNVTLNRSILADGTWYTLCLPFDMSAEKVNEVFGASTIAELTSAEDRGSLIHLNFDYVHAIEARKAYLIKPGHDFVAGTVIPNVQIKNEEPIVSVAKDGETDLMHFQGTYNKITLRDSNIRFVAADNYLYSPKSATGTVMGAFRCYFTIPTGSPASAPGKRARIVMGEQTATGVQNVQSNQVSYTKMLRDGQLLIIREGRMYNAQGMIVSE